MRTSFDNKRVFGALPGTESGGRRGTQPYSWRKCFLCALICLVWLGFGLIGRDPWKPSEPDWVVLIADMLDTPSFENAPAAAQPPPLVSGYPILAAFFARILLPWLEIHEGARMLNVLLLAGGLLLIGGAVGRSRAGWMAALLAAGTTGFLVRAHLLNLAVPSFFGMALLLWGAVLLRRNALVGGAAVGGALGFLCLFAMPTTAVAGGLGLLATMGRKDWRLPSVAAGLPIALVFFAPCLLFLQMAAAHANVGVIAWLGQSFMPSISAETPANTLRIALWALFPILPIAVVALWQHRRAFWATPVNGLCVMLAMAAVAHFLLYGDQEEDFFFLLPPLSVLAAWGIFRLPDSYAAILDWFALGVVGLCVVGGMWAVWLILQTAAPAILAVDIDNRFAFLPMLEVSWWKVWAAAAVTVLWVGLAVNIGRSNERAVLNWSCGMAVVWCVFNLLWVKDVDAVKSYRGMAQELAVYAGGDCIMSQGVDMATLRQLYYFRVPLQEGGCGYVLRRTEVPPQNLGAKVWQGGRYGEKNYVLYKLPPPS